MIQYFDLDKKELVNPPGFGGSVRSYSFTRGDHTPLEVHFIKDGAEVTNVTNIVFILKATPGIASPSLAKAEIWENPAETTHFTALLNLNGNSLDALLGSALSKSLLCQISCFHAGVGPISSQLVTANVGGDLHRGDEDTPLVLDDPDAWLETRRPVPLARNAPPLDSDHQGSALVLTFAGANNNLTFTQVDAGDRIFVTLYVPTGVFPPPPVVVWNAVTRELTVSVNAGVTTAADVRAAIIAAIGTDEMTVAYEGTGAGFVEPAARTGFAGGVVGTVGKLGQLAIVTTTNDSGTFLDAWTCVRASPVKWSPPGHITRAPDGTLYRAIISNTGIPSIELAYP